MLRIIVSYYHPQFVTEELIIFHLGITQDGEMPRLQGSLGIIFRQNNNHEAHFCFRSCRISSGCLGLYGDCFFFSKRGLVRIDRYMFRPSFSSSGVGDPVSLIA